MLPRIYNFEQLDVFHRPAKILNEDEREYVINSYPLSTIRTISNDDIICIELGAREGDIICIRNNNTDTYRLVVGRKPLI
jgi:DNA-directed RNA polymerase subunit H (RpoH/RPB5)